jgi:hypothetical protein
MSIFTIIGCRSAVFPGNVIAGIAHYSAATEFACVMTGLLMLMSYVFEVVW